MGGVGEWVERDCVWVERECVKESGWREWVCCVVWVTDDVVVVCRSMWLRWLTGWWACVVRWRAILGRRRSGGDLSCTINDVDQP